jgi:hypothetical protein
MMNPSSTGRSLGIPVLANLISAVCNRWHRREASRILGSACLFVATVVFAIFVTGCAAYGPYHANKSGEPFNSVRGPKDGRYKLAIIEFGDQG